MKPLLTVDDLRSEGFDTVIVAAPDMSGRLVGKRLSPSRFDEFCEKGVAMSSCVVGWDIAQDIGLEVPYAGWHTGWRDFLLIPDLSSLRPAAWLDRTAIVMADCVEERDRTPVEVMPRTILRRQLEALQGDGLDAHVATEPEFHLYRGGYDDLRRQGFRRLEPTTLVHADYTIQQTNAWESFFQDVRRALDASGLGVELSQGEWGLGQWEINLEYGEALDACDRHTIFKLALKDMATRAGLAATFLARPIADAVGSSCHMHVSLRDASDTPAFYDEHDPNHVSDVLRHAVGGVLEHAPDLMAWYAPTINSYRRTNSEEFAGHGATWGFDNRTVSCRVLGSSPDSVRLEWRVPGADVNPFLALAGIVASIRQGIAGKNDPGPPAEGNAYDSGITPFSRHLGDAAEVFVSSEFVERAFGQAVVEQYGLTARYEWERFLEAVTNWELDRYFEHI